MIPKKGGLGRGLDALLGAATRGQPAVEAGIVTETLRQLPVEWIERGRYQPRQDLREDTLQELAESIRAQGVVQPVLVRPLGVDRYELIAGERRWRATQLAGLREIPAVIRDLPDRAAMAVALIENIQRENLNPLEEAQGLQRLIDEFSMTHQEAADAVGRSRPAASNLLRLLQLVPPVQELLMQGDIDMGHARALLPLSGALQIQLAQRIAQKGLSVREAERLAQQALKPPKKPEDRKPDRDLLRLQEELSDTLGAQVAIRTNKQGAGKIQIEFGNLDQLEGILQRLR